MSCPKQKRNYFLFCLHLVILVNVKEKETSEDRSQLSVIQLIKKQSILIGIQNKMSTGFIQCRNWMVEMMEIQTKNTREILPGDI